MIVCFIVTDPVVMNKINHVVIFVTGTWFMLHTLARLFSCGILLYKLVRGAATSVGLQESDDY